MKLCILTSLLFALTGCSTWDKLDQTEKGAVIGTGSGAVLGGAIGGGTGAVIGGVGGGVAGGLVGNQIDDDTARKRRDRY